MSRSVILFLKHIFALVHAYLWSRIVIMIILPSFANLGIIRSILVSLVLAGAFFLFSIGGKDKYVGNSINPHTYSMDHEGFFATQFNALIFSVIALLLISLIQWNFVFLNIPQISLTNNLFYWNGKNGLFIDLPIYIISIIFILFHRKFDMSKRILRDRSCVFDSWW